MAFKSPGNSEVALGWTLKNSDLVLSSTTQPETTKQINEIKVENVLLNNKQLYRIDLLN